MPGPKTLDQLYAEELRDLISGNGQMQQVVSKLADRATDTKLRELLQRSVTGIGQHADTIRSLLGSDQQNTVCKAMTGLVTEAQQHALESDLPAQLRDLEIIAQYQRMSHYGVAGFGTAKAYAQALGKTSEAQQLEQIVSDIYKADEYSSALAEGLERAVAAKS